jgi:type II secretory ATPase GspE/PulE/Tfp pilus assembly ATPase PilB-like protein
VLATLHASSIKEAISRLWAFLDEQGDELLVQSLQGIVAQHLIHIANNKKYCLYEALEVDKKVKNILNQVLDHNSQLTLNACDLRQKNRMTLAEKKQKLIVDGIDENLLNCISSSNAVSASLISPITIVVGFALSASTSPVLKSLTFVPTCVMQKSWKGTT